LAVNTNSQGNPSFPWRFIKTAKLINSLLGSFYEQPRKPTVSLAVYKNSQEITFSWRFSATAKETLYSLAARFWPPRKIMTAKINPFWCSEGTSTTVVLCICLDA